MRPDRPGLRSCDQTNLQSSYTVDKMHPFAGALKPMRAGSFSFLATGLMFLILAAATQAQNTQGSKSPVELRPPTL
jgi:hypothetical protein